MDSTSPISKPLAEVIRQMVKWHPGMLIDDASKYKLTFDFKFIMENENIIGVKMSNVNFRKK